MIIVFYIFSAILLACSLGTMLSTNLVHSALLMVGTFIGVAGLFLLLHADYLALVQILIYVGAIAVLVVFGVMLTRSKGSIKESNLPNRYKVISVVVALGLFALLVRAIVTTHFAPAAVANTEDAMILIAQNLLNNYVIAFEAVGFLLLVAVVGAIIIGREKE